MLLKRNQEENTTEGRKEVVAKTKNKWTKSQETQETIIRQEELSRGLVKFPWKAPPVSRYGKVCCNNLFVSLLGFIPKREGFAVANKKNALQKWKKRTLDIYNYLP